MISSYWRFQFRLSTVIALVFASGIIVCLNLNVTTIYQPVPQPHRIDAPLESPPSYSHVDYIGWPFAFIARTNDIDYPEGWTPRVNTYEFFLNNGFVRTFEFASFVEDLLVAILILVLTFGAWKGFLRLLGVLKGRRAE